MLASNCVQVSSFWFRLLSDSYSRTHKTKMADTAAAGPSRAPMHGAIGASKSRKTIVVEEDATKLQFGESANGDAITPTEVQMVLSMARSHPGVPPAPDNKVYKSTLEYVNEFANVPYEVVQSMRTALDAHPGFLNKFEMAQIMYLRPETVEVAVALIPSLERYAQVDEDSNRLQQMLEDIRQIAKYGARA